MKYKKGYFAGIDYLQNSL